jgi:hypothetical protein
MRRVYCRRDTWEGSLDCNRSGLLLTKGIEDSPFVCRGSTLQSTTTIPCCTQDMTPIPRNTLRCSVGQHAGSCKGRVQVSRCPARPNWVMRTLFAEACESAEKVREHLSVSPGSSCWQNTHNAAVICQRRLSRPCSISVYIGCCPDWPTLFLNVQGRDEGIRGWAGLKCPGQLKPFYCIQWRPTFPWLCRRWWCPIRCSMRALVIAPSHPPCTCTPR